MRRIDHQLKTNAFIKSNGWPSKSPCHSTLAKMVAYHHFTSFICLPMMTWLRWLDMAAAGSSPMDRLTNGWLQLKTNAFIESNGWLFKSHCHSTLAKMVAYHHFTSFLRLPMMTWLRWLDMAAGSLPMDRLTNAMVGYNWKPMLSSSPMVDSSKAIAIPHWPK